MPAMDERPPGTLIKITEAIRNQIVYGKTEYPVLDELDMEREKIGRSDLFLYLNYLVSKAILHGYFPYVVLRQAVPPPEDEREGLFTDRPHDWDLNDRSKIQFIIALHEKELLEGFYQSLISTKPQQWKREVEYDYATSACSFGNHSYIPESRDRKALLGILWGNRRVVNGGTIDVPGEALQQAALAVQIDLIDEPRDFPHVTTKMKQLITNLNAAFKANHLPISIHSVDGEAILIAEQ